MISRFVWVDVDGDQLVLVLEQRNLERVEDEAHTRFFVSVKRNKFFAEGLTEVVFLCEKGRSHANLKGACTDDSSTLKAGVGSCWLHHGAHLRANSQTVDRWGLLEAFAREVAGASPLLVVTGRPIVAH